MLVESETTGRRWSDRDGLASSNALLAHSTEVRAVSSRTHQSRTFCHYPRHLCSFYTLSSVESIEPLTPIEFNLVVAKFIAHKAQAVLLHRVIVGTSHDRDVALFGQSEDTGVHTADTAETE